MTANARAIGRFQENRFRDHHHAIPTLRNSPGDLFGVGVKDGNSPSLPLIPYAGPGEKSFGVEPQHARFVVSEGGTETRPNNTAFSPRLYV